MLLRSMWRLPPPAGCARQHRSHFAFMLVLLLLGCYEFQGIESVGKVRGSVLHKPDMRFVNQLVERRL